MVVHQADLRLREALDELPLAAAVREALDQLDFQVREVFHDAHGEVRVMFDDLNLAVELVTPKRTLRRDLGRFGGAIGPRRESSQATDQRPPVRAGAGWGNPSDGI